MDKIGAKKWAHFSNSEKFADVVALVRLEKTVDAHLLQIALAEVAGGVAGVELRVCPHVPDALPPEVNAFLTRTLSRVTTH
jgi:hypothetical protein